MVSPGGVPVLVLVRVLVLVLGFVFDVLLGDGEGVVTLRTVEALRPPAELLPADVGGPAVGAVPVRVGPPSDVLLVQFERGGERDLGLPEPGHPAGVVEVVPAGSGPRDPSADGWDHS